MDTSIRTYRGRSQAEAAAKVAADLTQIGESGYRIGTQSWAATGGISIAGRIWALLAVATLFLGILVWLPLLVVTPIAGLLALLGRQHGGELTVAFIRD